MGVGYHAGKVRIPGALEAATAAGGPEAKKAAAKPPGSPAAKADPAAAATVEAQDQASEDQKESTKAIVETEEQRAEKLEKATNEVYEGVDDVLSLLKKGIKLEDNFIQGRYRKVLKEATLEAFRIALMEHAVIRAKTEEQEGFRKLLSERGWELGGKLKGTEGEFAEMGMLRPGEDPYNIAATDQRKRWQKLTSGKQAGGAITETGMHLLHAGEYVMSAAQAANMRAAGMSPTGRGGGDTFNIYVNAQTDASPEQIASVVRYEMIRAKEKS
jgi:hypothetical protein